MTILKYNQTYKKQCIEIFDSNIGQYFAQSERAEFLCFLNNVSSNDHYYVYLQDERVIACGGIEIHDNIGGLTWGMVHLEFHGTGIGKALTTYRLSRLKAYSTVKRIDIDASQHTQGFYQKLGFSVVKIITNGFTDGLDCVFMQQLITC